MSVSMRRHSVHTLVLVAGLASVLPAHAQTFDPYFAKVRLNELQAAGLTGSGVRVGVMEGETVRSTHVSLNGQVEFTRPGGTVGGHPTHVASILAGKTTTEGGNFRGAAPGARLQSAWIGNPAGSDAKVQAFKDAADWLLLPPSPSIVNISWGWDWDDPASLQTGLSRTADWMVASRGMLVVAAAGNEGAEAGTAGGGYGTITNPGYGYNVLTVGQTSRDHAYNRLRPTSSRSAAGARVKPDLVAPGQRVNGATNDSDTSFSDAVAWSGTSFATPQVGGTAALLTQYGNANTLSTDTRVMRSVLMNSTNKRVEDLAGLRWDKNANLGRGAASISNETGTGQLDAMEAYNQYRAGRFQPTFGRGASGAMVNATGWDLGESSGTGEGSSNDYLTSRPLRKGSYLTATTVWNREVDATNANPNNWAYRTLTNIDLGVAELGSINTIRQRANATDGAAEHLSYKVQNRNNHYVRVWQTSAGATPETTYGAAWRAFEAPTELREFNGTFMGHQAYYLDNGWFDASQHGASSIAKPTFTNQDSDLSFAMALRPDSMGLPVGMAQELVTPSSGFWLTFEMGFDGALNDAALSVKLGGVDILAAAGFDGGLITPDISNTGQYREYTIDLSGQQALFAGLNGGFQDLNFFAVGYGGGSIFVDDVRYVPAPGSFALIGLGLLTAARRSRR